MLYFIVLHIVVSNYTYFVVTTHINYISPTTVKYKGPQPRECHICCWKRLHILSGIYFRLQTCTTINCPQRTSKQWIVFIKMSGPFFLNTEQNFIIIMINSFWSCKDDFFFQTMYLYINSRNKK